MKNGMNIRSSPIKKPAGTEIAAVASVIMKPLMLNRISMINKFDSINRKIGFKSRKK